MDQPKNDSANQNQSPLTPRQQKKLQDIQKRTDVSRQKKAVQSEHISRVRGAASGRGSVPGGLAESAAAMADPAYLEQTRNNVQRRREESSVAREAHGVRTPRRHADTESNMSGFRSGAGGGKVSIGRNPNIAARAERFRKG